MQKKTLFFLCAEKDKDILSAAPYDISHEETNNS
jgi:hypothetical protein